MTKLKVEVAGVVYRVSEGQGGVLTGENESEVRQVFETLGMTIESHECLRIDGCHIVAVEANQEPGTYRDGFNGGLRWVRERFNLDIEDVDALNAAIETGAWE